MKTAIASAIFLAWLFVGCASEPTCDYDDEPYIAAASVPPLKMPDGLTAPDRSAALVIPAAPPGAAEKPSGKGRCLDRPPSYFQTAPTAPKSDAKTDAKAEDKKNQ